MECSKCGRETRKNLWAVCDKCMDPEIIDWFTEAAVCGFEVGTEDGMLCVTVPDDRS